jgi:GTP cyclohydrolase II
MNHLPRDPAEKAPAPETPADPGRALREVHRAVAELRRGRPVLLTGCGTLVVLPAETALDEALDDLRTVAQSAPVLLLGAGRAAVLQGVPAPADENPVAFSLPDDPLTICGLREAADPTATENSLPRESVRLAPAALPNDAKAALILLKLARLLPAALVAEAHPGPYAPADSLDLLSVSAADVRSHAARSASLLARVAEAAVPLQGAPDARMVAFRAPDGGVEHFAIVVGQPEKTAAPLVRIHSECFTGDLLGSMRCDCGPQLRGAIARMAEEGAGVVLYLAQEGRGIGLVNKLRAYALQDGGLDTLDANRALGWAADERNFRAAAVMLEQLGVHAIRLLTNNPDKVAALRSLGIDVVAREPHKLPPNGVNDAYLATKAERFGHFL